MFGGVHKVQARSRDFGVTTAILYFDDPLALAANSRLFSNDEFPRGILHGTRSLRGWWFWPARVRRGAHYKRD